MSVRKQDREGGLGKHRAAGFSFEVVGGGGLFLCETLRASRQRRHKQAVKDSRQRAGTERRETGGVTQRSLIPNAHGEKRRLRGGFLMSNC